MREDKITNKIVIKRDGKKVNFDGTKVLTVLRESTMKTILI